MSLSLMTTKAFAGHSVGYCALRVFSAITYASVGALLADTKRPEFGLALFSTSSSVAYLVSNSLSGSRLWATTFPSSSSPLTKIPKHEWPPRLWDARRTSERQIPV